MPLFPALTHALGGFLPLGGGGVAVTPGVDFITISWGHDDDPEGAERTAYRVRWAVSGQPLSHAADIGPDETEHTITGLPSSPGGSAFDVGVSSVGAGGESIIMTATVYTAPASAPSGLSATVIDHDTVSLAWTPPATPPINGGQMIERSTDGLTGWTEDILTDGAASLIVLEDRVPATTLHYRVSSYNTNPTPSAKSVSIPSNTVSATTPAQTVWFENLFESPDIPDGFSGGTFGVPSPAPGSGLVYSYPQSGQTLALPVPLTEFWIYGRFAVSALTSGPYILRVRNGATELFRLRVNVDGKIRLQSGSTPLAPDTANPVAPNTNRSFWLYYKAADSGSNGIVSLYHSPDRVRPGAPLAHVTNFPASPAVDTVLFATGVSGVTSYMDELMISTTDPGSNPFGLA